MSDTPLYSRELKKLRGNTSTVSFAKQCGVSRETIRLVEKGELLPSKELLFSWMSCASVEPLFRTDILQDVIRRKVAQSSLAREIEELKEIAYPSTEGDLTGLIEELTDVFMEVGSLKESMREGQLMRIKRIFNRHITKEGSDE